MNFDAGAGKTTLDFSLCQFSPFKHQREGVVKLVEESIVGLFDEMGAGKTKQVIDAAQFLFQMGVINQVIIICPAAVRSVWYHPEFGELKKHLWDNVSSIVYEYHASTKNWIHGKSLERLQWVITNYDYVRDEDRRDYLMSISGPHTWIVLDESSYVKNHKADQTKSCLAIRRKCSRVTLLNGTPIANSPMDMYSQGQIMDPSILECGRGGYYTFRNRYAITGGFKNKQIVGFRNLDDLQRRFAPYVLRRLKKDCLDLPPKLDPITLFVPLSKESWKVYRDMRDEMVAWLDQQTVAVSAQAAVKAMRLAQITSGFIGGLEGMPELEQMLMEEPPDFIPIDGSVPERIWPEGPIIQNEKFRPVGREKLDFFLTWLDDRLAENPKFKLLVWCRFRPELDRLFQDLTTTRVRGKLRYPTLTTAKLHGGQPKAEREIALRLLDPRTAPDGPALLAGTPSTGRMGFSLTAADTVVYLSNDYSLFTRLQSEDRVHRPGQTRPVSYFDIVATGPDGQRTIDHKVIQALHSKESMATFTTEAWRRILTEE